MAIKGQRAAGALSGDGLPRQLGGLIVDDGLFGSDFTRLVSLNV
jgi:hypothetical protein